MNHLNGESSEGSDRNVLVEAGRIARGKISPLQVNNTLLLPMYNFNRPAKVNIIAFCLV